MTDAAPDIPQTSTLPFDPAELTDLRVSQAGFARMLGVSRQTVSVMVKSGRVTVGPDGLIDPKRAAKEYLRNTDPARMRVKILQEAVYNAKDLRARIAGLEADLAKAREQIDHLDGFVTETDRADELFMLALHLHEARLRGTEDSAAWSRLLGGLRDVADLATGPAPDPADDLALDENTEAMVEALRRAADSQAMPAGSCNSEQGSGVD